MPESPVLCTGMNGILFRGFGGQIPPTNLIRFLRSPALWAGSFTPDSSLTLDGTFSTFSIVAFRIMKPWLQFDLMLGKDQENGKCNLTQYAICELMPAFPSSEGE